MQLLRLQHYYYLVSYCIHFVI